LPIPLRVLSGFAGVVMASAAVFRGLRATVFCTLGLVAYPVPYLLALFLCKLLAKKTLLHFQGLGCSMYCCEAQSLSILFSAHTWNRSPVSSWWASFGVCGLLAVPTIHQIFGDNPAEYPLSACLGVGFLLLRAVCSGCGCDGNIGHFSLRTSFWGTQWGQLNRPHTLLLL